MTALDVLDRTEQLIRTHGWKATSLQHCLLGRAYEAAGARFGHVSTEAIPALFDALNAIRTHLGTPQLSLWNSESGRTVEEVLAAIAGGRVQLQSTSNAP